MANYFVDSTTGNDGDAGTTMDDAWATLEHAHEAGGLSAGDIVWVRRIHVEYSGAPTSHLALNYDGTVGSPIKTIGWPRAAIANTTITQADWTNGSTTVDNIVGITCDRTEHQGRYATAPDGNMYQITQVVDSNTVTICREYAGSTVTGTNGKFQVEEDEYYDTAQAIDDSGWTITVATWTADDDSMPSIDFQNAAYVLYADSANFHEFHGIEFRDGSNASGVVYLNTCKSIFFQGCLFHQDQNTEMFHVRTSVIDIDRCIIEGSGAGASQVGIWFNSAGELLLKNSAVYNMGDYGLYLGSSFVNARLENVNIGVETANGDDDIYATTYIFGRDVKLGGTNGDVVFNTSSWIASGIQQVAIENYNKTLGDHKTFLPRGVLTKVTAGAGGDVPNQRSGGNATLIEVDFNVAAAEGYNIDNTSSIFTSEFEVDTTSYDYRIYIQNMGEIAATKLKLIVEYVSSYDDTSEYVITRTEGSTSSSPLPARADADDWGEYIEVTGIQAAVASKVRLKLLTNWYHATNKFYIDPLVTQSES